MMRTAWLILRKDLTVEVRSREIAYTTVFFAVACVLVFAFALVKEGKAPEDGAERQSETLRALLMAPAPRPAVYIGKLLGILVLLAGAEVVLVPLVALLFQAGLLRHPFWLVAILATGTLGFAAVGTLFAAMLVRARSRDVLLPVLLYPITVPVIIAGVRGTAALLQPEFEIGIARFWLALLVTFDVVFVTLALWTFESVMTD
jgi:ABC-type transport system involved in cytochrome c biogenesis permease component